MATFSFPYHTCATDYPDSSFRAKLGNSYEYSAAPSAPDQRIFTLRFALMKYFTLNGQVDATVQPELNLLALENFYNLHKTYATFTYPHPVYGDVACRFNKPFKIPQGLVGGDGAVANIEIELIEMPGLSDSGISEMTQIEYVDLPAV